PLLGQLGRDGFLRDGCDLLEVPKKGRRPRLVDVIDAVLAANVRVHRLGPGQERLELGLLFEEVAAFACPELRIDVRQRPRGRAHGLWDGADNPGLWGPRVS